MRGPPFIRTRNKSVSGFRHPFPPNDVEPGSSTLPAHTPARCRAHATVKLGRKSDRFRSCRRPHLSSPRRIFRAGLYARISFPEPSCVAPTSAHQPVATLHGRTTYTYSTSSQPLDTPWSTRSMYLGGSYIPHVICTIRTVTAASLAADRSWGSFVLLVCFPRQIPPFLFSQLKSMVHM